MFYLLRVEKSQEAILLSSVEFWNTQGAGNLGLVGQTKPELNKWWVLVERARAPSGSVRTNANALNSPLASIKTVPLKLRLLHMPCHCSGMFQFLWRVNYACSLIFFVILFVFSHCSKICVCLLAEMCFLVLPNQSHQGASVWQGLRPQAVNFLLKVHIPKLTSTCIVIQL